MDASQLAAFPLFAELEEEQRAEVASHLRALDVEAGTTLARQGSHAYELFLVHEGEAEVRRDDAVIAMLGPGDVFGEIGVLMTGTRTASVTATTPMRISAMFVKDYRAIHDAIPALAASLRETMRERIEEAPLRRS